MSTIASLTTLPRRSSGVGGSLQTIMHRKKRQSPDNNITFNVINVDVKIQIEIENNEGLCTIRHLVNTPDFEAVTITLINVNNIDPIRRALLTELWGADIKSFEEVSMNTLKLLKTPPIKLNVKKLQSLAKK
ncbi:hypothetical protein AXG93_669s1150 [Marchantia polymorpha subsp. ruderalis]|uniref:Uncharacterized protein n=1 Tax=Marchantia polymorpha subsp. ruderalis TaxID=1480154 RepID=A0A176WCY3_MARPO|nr:hypothetical protein AXG93_669s1150 [Marchantia polymorpha subsp. ruderalis]